MPHVIDGARLYSVYRLYTEHNSVYVHKLVPLSGNYTYMITTTGQCTLDNGVKGGRAIVISMVSFIYTYSPSLNYFSLKDLLVY